MRRPGARRPRAPLSEAPVARAPVRRQVPSRAASAASRATSSRGGPATRTVFSRVVSPAASVTAAFGTPSAFARPWAGRGWRSPPRRHAGGRRRAPSPPAPSAEQHGSQIQPQEVAQEEDEEQRDERRDVDIADQRNDVADGPQHRAGQRIKRACIASPPFRASISRPPPMPSRKTRPGARAGRLRCGCRGVMGTAPHGWRAAVSDGWRCGDQGHRQPQGRAALRPLFAFCGGRARQIVRFGCCARPLH